MSEAIEGLRNFWAVTTNFGILDDTAGYVGTGSIGLGYTE